MNGCVMLWMAFTLKRLCGNFMKLLPALWSLSLACVEDKVAKFLMRNVICWLEQRSE